MNIRPKNNNTNALIGNNLGPVVYRLKSGVGEQYVFLNPKTMANLLGVNVNKLNETLNRKSNNNVFEKLKGNFGRSIVQNPFYRGNITKKNITKMNGPKNPVKTSVQFNMEKARKNANKLRLAREKQQRAVARREARERFVQNLRTRARSFFRRPQRQQNNNNYNNTLREARARERLINSIGNMYNTIAEARGNGMTMNNIPIRARANMTRLQTNYEAFKNLDRAHKRLSPVRLLEKRRLKQQMKTTRTRIENLIKSLGVPEGNSINRLSVANFKNAVYGVLRKNGLSNRQYAYRLYAGGEPPPRARLAPRRLNF
jgi:hypothetical protein